MKGSKEDDERLDEAEHRIKSKRQAGQKQNPQDEVEATDTVRAVEETKSTDMPESTATKPNAATESSSDMGKNDDSSVVSSSAPIEETDDAVILSESETAESGDDSSVPLNGDDAVIIDNDTDAADTPSEAYGESDPENGRDENSHAADELENTTRGTDRTYRCPACEFELPVSESSYFPGDVCPQCRVGYLEDTSNRAS
jgi:hypothetical protein